MTAEKIRTSAPRTLQIFQITAGIGGHRIPDGLHIHHVSIEAVDGPHRYISSGSVTADCPHQNRFSLLGLRNPDMNAISEYQRVTGSVNHIMPVIGLRPVKGIHFCPSDEECRDFPEEIIFHPHILRTALQKFLHLMAGHLAHLADKHFRGEDVLRSQRKYHIGRGSLNIKRFFRLGLLIPDIHGIQLNSSNQGMVTVHSILISPNAQPPPSDALYLHCRKV